MMPILDEVRERLSDKVLSCQVRSEKRIYLGVRPEDIRLVAGVLFRDLGLRFITASGQDTPEGIEILYHFSFDPKGEIFSVRLLIEDKKNPKVDSLAPLFSGAEWIEREIWELLGVDFIGHPNLKHLLLVDEWPEGKYPLRHKHES